MLFALLKNTFSILFLLNILVACGSRTETIEVHDYTMAVIDDDPEVKWEFENLINEFNSYAGLNVIQYVDHADQANSVVFLTKDLKINSDQDNKIGYGQWLAEIEEEKWYSKPGQDRQRIIRYAMRIELDEDYIRSRMDGDTIKAKKEKQVLFFHEVGHGLEMDHVQDRNDIMYEEVAQNRDYGNFFERVRNYMTK